MMPVRYLADPQLTALVGALRRERAALLEALVAASSWDDFIRRSGMIAGIDIALGLADRIERTTN